MGCLVATAVEAVVVSAIKKNEEKKEQKCSEKAIDLGRIPWSRKLGWLSKMLWGGSFLLLIEHMWHGEIVPWFPFFTAMNNPADIKPMLMEILTVGGTMALTITAIWFGLCLAADYKVKKVSALATSK